MKPANLKAAAAFRARGRRQADVPLGARLKCGFSRLSRPVRDAAPWRSFDAMAAHRAYGEANLPDCVGFKRAA